MRRVLAASFALAVALAVPAAASAAPAPDEGYHESLCQQRPFLCVDPSTSIGENGEYTGHDEPSVLFQSHRRGTGGGDLTYYVNLPNNPPTPPAQDASGGTWDFQLRATFWLGLAMCDTQSAPNFRNTCRPNSDRNARYRSFDPNSRYYIGKSPGNAYMELQFYSPGWVPQFDGFGCTATKWCANLTIDSLSDQTNTGVQQNSDCLDNHYLVGEEPVNWAYITKSGVSQAPANPLALSDDPNLTGLIPDPTQDLLMNSGDRLKVHLHDTRAGYRVDIYDLTTGQHGSMTASKANGFGHVLFEPNATTCHVEPYAFHPMYSSAVQRGTTWGAHTYNVAASDEIGHFEYCNATDPATFNCTQPGVNDTTLDDDDQLCLNGANYPGAFPIIGCMLDDGDFDGPSYKHDWPGSLPDVSADRQVHETPIQFTVPKTHRRSLEKVSFETDLARIERGEPAGNVPGCDATTGAGCVNPPPGAEFYPIYTLAHVNGRCMFQQGDVNLPGTFNTFGGSSATEYGTDVLFVTYPDTGWTTTTKAQDFHRDLGGNPCWSSSHHRGG